MGKYEGRYFHNVRQMTIAGGAEIMRTYVRGVLVDAVGSVI